MRTKLKTKVIENETNPQWPVIKGNILFRGTINELEYQKLRIKILNFFGLNSTLTGIKILDLVGVVDSGIITTDLVQRFKHREEHQCSIKGRINIHKVPKYRQTGELVLLNSSGQYLCVTVMRVDNVVLASDKGVVNTFIELG